jgi:hypothetical protein
VVSGVANWIMVIFARMANNQISVTQYAANRGITRQAVLKQIIKGRSLPGVTKVEKIGATYVLTVFSANS